MSGGFFRGTSADQDTRFSNKQAKLLKSQKFASELDHLVDMRKVKMDVIRPWIANRVTELLGFEDEVLINFIYGLLDGKEVNGKEVQISLTGFMEKNTGKFMKELWTLLLSAQNNESGVPQQFLDAKEEETRRKQAEVDRITNEIQKKKEMESREIEQERSKKMDGGVESKAYNAAKELDSKHILSKGITGNPEVDKSDNGNGVRGRNSTSPPHIGKSLSNSRSYSGDRQKSRSVSRSPVTRGRSISSDRKYRSPRERSNTPRRKHSPHSPPRKRSSYPRHRSRSPSRRRSPSLVLRRNRSPYKRRSPSPVRRRLSSPSRRRRSPSLIRRRRSPSPMHRRSRSPMRSKSPLPVRRRSPLSPRRRLPSPLRRKYHRSPSTPRKWSLSPIRHKSPRPARRRTLVASRRRSPSPYGSSSPSPIRRRSPSPIPTRRRSPAPSRVRSPSPYRSVSPPHTRRRSPAPIPLRGRSPAPSCHRSPSPYGSGSPSHTRRRSPSPIPPRRRSPAPSRLRSPSPIPPRRRSPVPSRLRSPSPYASSSPSARRNSLSPVRKRSSRSLVQSPAQRRTQGKKSPVRCQPSRSLTPPRRDRKDLRSEVKALSPSPKRSPIRSASPSLTRNKSPGEHRRSSSSYESPVRHIKGRVIDDASISLQKPREGKQHHRSPGINRDDKEIGYAWGEGGDPKPSALQKRSENSSTIIKQKDLSAKVDYKDGQSREKLSGRMTIDSQNHPDKMESRKKDQETKSEKSSGRGSYLENLDRKGSPASYKLSYRQRQSYAGEESDEQNHSQLNNIKDSDKGDKSGTGPVLVGKVDHDDGGNVCVSGSEESDKHRTEIKEKRKHKKRSHRRDVTSDDDYSYDSEIEDRKEAKRRRKEEKKLRKEEKRRRREERRHRKEERRAEKLKLKDQNHSSSSDDEHRGGRRGSNLIDDEETPAEQQKLEIELRQKALESLKAKKGINY